MHNTVKYTHYQLRLYSCLIAKTKKNKQSKQTKKKHTNLEIVAINEAVNVLPQEIHISERLQHFYSFLTAVREVL